MLQDEYIMLRFFCSNNHPWSIRVGLVSWRGSHRFLFSGQLHPDISLLSLIWERPEASSWNWCLFWVLNRLFMAGKGSSRLFLLVFLPFLMFYLSFISWQTFLLRFGLLVIFCSLFTCPLAISSYFWCSFLFCLQLTHFVLPLHIPRPFNWFERCRWPERALSCPSF